MYSKSVLVLVLASLTVLHCPVSFATTQSCAPVCDASGANCEVPTVCQPCDDINVCPECFYDNGTSVYGTEPCCKVYANVLTITATAAQASAFATAAAFSSAVSASQVVLYAIAATSVGAAVSVSQTVSFTVNSDTCCHVDTTASADAASNAEAFAQAAALAAAYANASASASAFASASAEAAAGLLAQAESLIESSCCGFSGQFSEFLEVLALYSSYAETSSQASASVSASAFALSLVVTEAQAQVETAASAMADLEVNNCCNDSAVFDSAHATALACAHACDFAHACASDIDGLFTLLFQFNFSEDISLIDYTDGLSLCVTECSDVGLSCCPAGDASPCCQANPNATVCTASELAIEVFNSAKALVASFAGVLTVAIAEVQTYVSAISAVQVGAYSAANASVAIQVQVTSCKDVQITVDRVTIAQSAAVANAISNAAGVAQANSLGFGAALAFSAAAAEAIASAEATVSLYNLGAPCCGSLNYYANVNSLSCCDVLQAFSNSYSSIIEADAALDWDFSLSTSSSFTFDTLNAAADSCTSLIERARARSVYFFTLPTSCRCCESGTSGGGGGLISGFPSIFGRKK